ncbi:TANK-binding kinase 1-binding protein 1 [Triplophysa tibetana]|uniref:TANK-binding kinase 1-binding protein 1 n=1 Tax=Triplophysa tibetana TaxID=1572043 RepID=A0A5A9PYA0_9TELE|nr:TANK-binding kinase 1-binding protein 1 [Triplophysa tibetana]
MESLFGSQLGLLGGNEGLKEDGCGVGWPSSPLSEDMYSASHFTLISAYQDIKSRLNGLERENTDIKRKLKIYEIKFPMISEFGDDRNSYCSFETKDTALLHSENGSLQQRVNMLSLELQKGKEREEQLEDVIQAYEKIHMEKTSLQRDLDKMSSMVEKHVERIHSLESALRQRESSLHKLNTQLHNKDMQYLQLHSPDSHMFIVNKYPCLPQHLSLPTIGFSCHVLPSKSFQMASTEGVVGLPVRLLRHGASRASHRLSSVGRTFCGSLPEEEIQEGRAVQARSATFGPSSGGIKPQIFFGGCRGDVTVRAASTAADSPRSRHQARSSSWYQARSSSRHQALPSLQRALSSRQRALASRSSSRCPARSSSQNPVRRQAMSSRPSCRSSRPCTFQPSSRNTCRFLDRRSEKPGSQPVLDCPMTLQSSRSLDTLSDLKLQRLEAELEGARHEAQGACQREEELKAECERLREELGELQSNQRQREVSSTCGQCDVEWIKKVGDEQVNLALAYTELTEELGKLQALTSKQTEILRKASQEPASPVQRHSPVPHQRHSPVPQRHSPIQQRHSPIQLRHSPVPQRRSPVLQRLSPDMHRRSPLPDLSDGPASYSCRPTSHHLRASFQGRRSYSEVADPSAYQRPPRFTLDPVSTLPKPRPYVDSYHKQQQQQQKQQHGVGQHMLVQRQSSQGVGGDGGLAESPRLSRELSFHHSDHLHFEPQPSPASLHPSPQPPQSSEDEEEWPCPHPISPSRTLSVSSPSSSSRGPASFSAFPIPSRPNTLSCHPPGYLHAEHAQSWPSINLWMETEEEGDVRSCPLCQLIFPVGYPDDALIKHIDSHLENSKI